MKTLLFRSAPILAALALAGCGEDQPDVSTPPPAALTYWDDVAPILNNKCVGCHTAGGIAPFRLDRYTEARQNALKMAVATREGVMPPYLVTHDGTCGDFEDAGTLTADEKAKIWDWASGERKEGTPAVLQAPPVLSLGPAREWKTPNIVPVAEGGQLAEFDEYRCFPMDSGMDKDSFITGYEVLPGNPALVHHLVAFLVDPEKTSPSGKTNAEVMAALDAVDPDRPGWSCFGLPDEELEVDGVPAVWAPGQGPIVYPTGVGIQQKASHKVVIQLHYNLAGHHGTTNPTPSPAGMSDSTTLRLRHADEVDRPGVFVTVDGFLDTLFGDKPPASLAAGQKSVKYSWSMTGKEMGLGDDMPYLDVIGVMPHMHERGVSQVMKLGPEGGQMACAAQVNRWDFNWQKFYFYKTPQRLTPTSRLEMTCDYDTSLDDKEVLPGWGTRNEMCAAILMIVPPPAP
jgi:Copper type II ascorbate-dependent monooxygenase, C-terminal domain/Copper type II ascorbate-dependent monooxygenase, N-terminal domain